jgi:hypothetical protein
MVYCSIDIETTGLDREKHQVLSIGAIVEDTRLKLPYDQIPKFHGIILRHEITGSPRALSINKGLIEMIGTYMEGNPEVKSIMEQRYGKIFYTEEQIIPELFRFLYRNGLGKIDINERIGQLDLIDGVYYPPVNGKTKPITLNVAGKNFGTFDKPFLEKLPWFQKLINIRQRILDPGILCVDWKNDESLPNLTECKKRCGVEGIVTHNALEDAWDVIEVLRKNY